MARTGMATNANAGTPTGREGTPRSASEPASGQDPMRDCAHCQRMFHSSELSWQSSQEGMVLLCWTCWKKQDRVNRRHR